MIDLRFQYAKEAMRYRIRVQGISVRMFSQRLILRSAMTTSPGLAVRGRAEFATLFAIGSDNT